MNIMEFWKNKIVAISSQIIDFFFKFLVEIPFRKIIDNSQWNFVSLESEKFFFSFLTKTRNRLINSKLLCVRYVSRGSEISNILRDDLETNIIVLVKQVNPRRKARASETRNLFFPRLEMPHASRGCENVVSIGVFKFSEKRDIQ